MRQLRWQLLLALATNVLIVGMGFVTSVLLVRLLLPEGRGTVAAVLLWPNLIQTFGTLGLVDAIVYFGAKQEYKTGEVFYNAVVLGLIQSGFLMLLGGALLPVLLANQGYEVIQLAQANLLAIPFTILSQYGLSIIQAQMRSVKLNLIRLFIPVGNFAIIVIAALLGIVRVDLIVIGMILLNVSVLVVVLGMLRGSGAFQHWRVLPALGRDMLAYGFKFVLGIVFASANIRLDQVLLTIWSTTTVLGLYVVSVNSANLVMLLPTALHYILPPALAREQELPARIRLVERLFPPFWTLCICVVVVLAVLFPFLLPFLYGPETVDAVLTAEILLVAALMLCGRAALASASLGLGVPLFTTRAEAVSAVLTVVLLLLFIQPLGMVGAAITSVIAYGASMVQIARDLHRRFGLRTGYIFDPRVGFAALWQEGRQLLKVVRHRFAAGMSPS